MTNEEIASLKKLCLLSPQGLHRQLVFALRDYGYGVNDLIITRQYIMAAGDLPVCLIAHLDTVFDQEKHKEKEIYVDTEHQVMWSPQGLGTDDRAGVFAIISIIQSGLKPHIIFTTDEESGGLGASALVKDFLDCPFKNANFLIELDRAHEKDCVFYSCENKDFEDYIIDFDFEYAIGTFTDISIISPRWGIAAVNLSVGYYQEHSSGEHLVIPYLLETIEKVKKILQNQKEHNIMYEYIEGRVKKPNAKMSECLCCQEKVAPGCGFDITFNNYIYTVCKNCDSLLNF